MRAVTKPSALIGIWIALLAAGAARADLVAFRTHEGRYLSAVEGGGEGLTADRREARGWETFRLIRLEGNRVALLTERGYFLTAAGRDGGLAADAWDVGEAEIFRMIRLREGEVALETYRGDYVSADDSRVRAESSRIDREETFELLSRAGSGPAVAAGGQDPDDGIPSDGQAVAIRAWNGEYLTVGRFETALATTSGEPGYGETFQMQRLGSGRVALMAPNGDYVAVDSYGYLEATGRRIGERETFRMRQEGAGTFSLEAANGRFVSADDSGARGLRASAREVGRGETFRMVRVDEDPYGAPGGQGPDGRLDPQQPSRPGRTILIQTDKGQLVAPSGPGGTLLANRLQASRDTVFELVTLEEETPEVSRVALRSSNGTYVTVADDGRLRTGAGRIGERETFRLRREAGGYSLRAANGRFVAAEDGGGRELVANRDLAKSWEIFRFHEVDPAGTAGPSPGGAYPGPSGGERRRVAFETERGYYLGLDQGGTRIVARAVAPSADETFELVRLEGDRWALAAPNGRYVTAEGGGGAGLVANSSEVGDWESFRIVSLNDGRIGLLTARSRYVTAERGGGEVTARAYEARSWESFRMVERP